MSKPDANAAEKKGGNPNTKKIIGFVVAVGLFALLWLVPIIPNMPMDQQHVLALLAFTITCWITRPWMPALTGMMFIILAWGLGLADEKAALYGFSDSTPWFIWGGLLMALAVRTTNLHLRIAYSLLSKTSASTQGVIAIQYVVHYVLSLIIPSTTARVTTTAPIAASQIEALGLPIKSRAGKMMMISLIMAPFLFTRGTLTGGSTQILAWGILNENGISLSWLQWYLYMLFPVVIAAILLFIGLNFLFRPEKPGLVSQTGDSKASKVEAKKAIRKIAQDQLAELGKFSRGELKVTIILVLAVVLWCTESIHGISADLVGIGIGVVMCLPVIGVLDAKEALRKINWSNIAFVAAALSIGQVTEKSGVGEWLAGILEPLLRLGGSELVFLLLLLVLGFFGRLLLRSGAANAAVLLIPIVTLAASMGYHPVLVGVLFSMILAGIFIYQHTYGLIAYDYGAFEEADFIKASLVRYAAVALSIVLSYFIWWPLVGVI
jgi:anion transporter